MFFHYQSDAMPYTVPRGITWSGVKESSMTSRRTSKTRNAWQSLAYSPLGAPWRIQMTHTYLLIAALPSSPAPYWTYLKSPQKIFRPRLYNFLCLKLRGHWTESHQISTRCTDMIDNYSAKIKIAIFQFIWKRQRDEWRSSSNCGQILAKIAHFNSVNWM